MGRASLIVVNGNQSQTKKSWSYFVYIFIHFSSGNQRRHHADFIGFLLRISTSPKAQEFIFFYFIFHSIKSWCVKKVQSIFPLPCFVWKWREKASFLSWFIDWIELHFASVVALSSVRQSKRFYEKLLPLKI